jgi:hypothetical protein
MTFKKASAKEWREKGLPSSTWTISFGHPWARKPSFVLGSVKKPAVVPDPKSPRKKINMKRDSFPLLNATFLVVEG